jgi:Uma2 family endonuclease
MTQPGIKFTVNDYMTAPEEKRYQLLDGEMIAAPSRTSRHQAVLRELSAALDRFVTENALGEVLFAPLDVVLSDYDVAQPDLLFVSNARAGIVTEANVQGAPDLVVEVLSPASTQYDRGYKRTLYGRSGAREYWIVDPESRTVEVYVAGDEGLAHRATYGRREVLASPLLTGLAIDLEGVFGLSG